MTEDSGNVKVTRVQASQATGARRATKDAEANQVTGSMRNDMNVLVSPAETVTDGWVVSREASFLDMLRMDGRGSEGWRDWFEGVESDA